MHWLNKVIARSYYYVITTGMLFWVLAGTGGWSGSVEEVGKVDYIPLQRVGSKEEMAHAVLFLVSECCPYITGAMRFVRSFPKTWLTVNIAAKFVIV